MENATKALSIAATVLLGIMILSLIVMGYRQISSYYQQNHELVMAEQLDKFNKQFQGYNRKDIRGSDMISFMNKVIDYNVNESYTSDKNFNRITVEIRIDSNLIDEFKYDKSGISIVNPLISNITGAGSLYDKDRALIEITSTPTKLIDLANSAGINMSEIQLQKLEIETANIIFDDTKSDFRTEENKKNREVILKRILGIDVTSSQITTIKNIVNQYYQYTRFKRAFFECTEMIHDTETGRITGIKFKVQTKVQGGETVVKFD